MGNDLANVTYFVFRREKRYFWILMLSVEIRYFWEVQLRCIYKKIKADISPKEATMNKYKFKSVCILANTAEYKNNGSQYISSLNPKSLVAPFTNMV